MILETLNQLVLVAQNNLPLLVSTFDFALKSAFLIAIAKYYENITAPFFTSAQKYKLWLTVLLLLGLLPALPLLSEAVTGGFTLVPNVNLVTVLVPSDLAERTTDTSNHYSQYLRPLLGVYIFIALFHAAKLCLSLKQIRSIRRSADFSCPPAARLAVDRLRCKLGITRTITLGTCDRCSSPMTYGVFTPTIILPSPIFYRDEALLESILLHELGHIKRFDHPTYILCFLVAALNWFNPFIWVALKQVELQSEYACDNEVMKHHKTPCEFAAQLLALARWGLHRNNAALSGRALITRGQLSLRIENILESNVHLISGKTYSSLLPIVSLLLLFLLTGSGKIFALESERAYASEALRLVHKEIPAYPDAAFEKGITGFAQFSFRVDEAGRIDANSIVLRRSDPNNLFEEASMSALSKFVFAPRKVNGKRVPTSGVSYTFEFDIRI